jgi:hypothetical protein
MTTPKPKLTDAAVAALPIRDGRVELLEEIMASPVIDRVTEPTAPRGRRTPRWVAAVGAAAAVIAVAAVPLWITQGGDNPGEKPGNNYATGVEGTGERAVLTADGWTVDNVTDDDKYGGEISYSKGSQSLQITWYPADQYDGYVTDREHINHPEVDPGQAVDVLGSPSHLWAYSNDDHTVIRAAGDKYFLEVRGGGMNKQAFLALLGDLRLVTKAGLEDALPANFVTKAERPAAIAGMLDGMGTLPPGFDTAGLTSQEPDRYNLGAHVSGAVSCAWIEEFKAAKAAGAQARMDDAVAAMQASKQWPILLEMNADGDYPPVVWEYADRMQAGENLQGYRPALGC